MRTVLALIAIGFGTAQAIWADPVYTHSADFFTGNWDPGVGYSFEASGPGFSIHGGFGAPGPPFAFQVGTVVPLDFLFTPGEQPGGMVDFGGILLPSGIPQGSANQTTATSFVIPQNPSATYTFSATVAGEFTAFPMCDPFTMNCPPSGTQANLLINLPGQLTVTLHSFGPSAYTISETFVSTAVPEPSTIAFLALSVGAAGACFRYFRNRRAGI